MGWLARVALVAWLVVGPATQARATLLSFWNFNESGGPTANDSVGSADGALTGAASFVSGGVTGNAISLSTSSPGYVTMGDTFNFSGADDFSVQAWVKLSVTGAQVPVARHQSTVVGGYFVGINDTGDGCSAAGKAHLYAGYPCSGTSSTTVNDGAWHQLVGTYTSTGGWRRIYVDGSPVEAASGGAPFAGVTAPFVVGGVLNSAGTTITPAFDGLVDNVAVWNHALSDAEVSALYASGGNPVPEPASLLLLGSGLGALGVVAWRRARRR